MNKRAGISEHGILNIIFAVIVVIALFVTMPVIYRVIMGGGGGTARTASVALDSLSQGVFKLAADQSTFLAIRNYPLFIQPDAYIIVAFNSNDDKVKSYCENEDASRPKECLPGKACLCLYLESNGHDFDGGIWKGPPPIKCDIFPENIVFTAPLSTFEEGGDIVQGWNFGWFTGTPSIEELNTLGGGPMQAYLPMPYSYENLMLFGDCGASWNNQKVYIEKFANAGTIYVYISRESKYTQARFDALAKQFQVQPISV